MRIIKAAPEINLIAFDNWQKLISSAWLTSRPQVNPKEIDMLEILKIDTPVSEMAGLVVHFKVPILVREIIASMRDHIIWARTSRVDDLTKQLEVINTITDKEEQIIEKQMQDLLAEVGLGNPQDSFRKHLPLGYMTEFTCRLSLRSAIKLIGYLRLLGERYTAIRKPLHDIAMELALILQDNKVPICKELFESIKIPEYCQKFETHTSGVTEVTENFITVNTIIPLSLRAQVIRHRTLQVVDGLQTIMASDNPFAQPISKHIAVSISASVDTWKSIIAKRNCWLAQTDLWAYILPKVNHYLGESDLLLPCSDGVCPYSGDCMQRIKKEDPGLPCPRNILLHPEGKQLLVENFPEYDKQARLYVKESARPFQFWHGQINNLLREF